MEFLDLKVPGGSQSGALLRKSIRKIYQCCLSQGNIELENLSKNAKKIRFCGI